MWRLGVLSVYISSIEPADVIGGPASVLTTTLAEQEASGFRHIYTHIYSIYSVYIHQIPLLIERHSFLNVTVHPTALPICKFPLDYSILTVPLPTDASAPPATVEIAQRPTPYYPAKTILAATRHQTKCHSSIPSTLGAGALAHISSLTDMVCVVVLGGSVLVGLAASRAN